MVTLFSEGGGPGYNVDVTEHLYVPAEFNSASCAAFMVSWVVWLPPENELVPSSTTYFVGSFVGTSTLSGSIHLMVAAFPNPEIEHDMIWSLPVVTLLSAEVVIAGKRILTRNEE